MTEGEGVFNELEIFEINIEWDRIRYFKIIINDNFNILNDKYWIFLIQNLF